MAWRLLLTTNLQHNPSKTTNGPNNNIISSSLWSENHCSMQEKQLVWIIVTGVRKNKESIFVGQNMLLSHILPRYSTGCTHNYLSSLHQKATAEHGGWKRVSEYITVKEHTALLNLARNNLFHLLGGSGKKF